MVIRYAVDTSGPLHKVVRAHTLAQQERALAEELAAATEEAAALARDLTDVRRRARALLADARANQRRRAAWIVREALLRPNAEADRAAGHAAVTGEALRRARTTMGLGQRELAERTGISRSWLAEAERGRRPMPDVLIPWVRQTLQTLQAAEDAEEVAS